MICGERGTPMPATNPLELLGQSASASFFARLADDVLMDVFIAFTRSVDRTNRIDCILLDLARAEFSRRHAPAERGLEIHTHPIFPELWEVRGPDGYGTRTVLCVGTLRKCIAWERENAEHFA